MTRHLDDTERIDALEGTLAAARHAHLDECAECRHTIAELRAVWEDLRIGAGDDMPEPSPLFWNHFPVRVAAAVDEVAAAEAVPWWGGSTRAWLGLAAAAAVVLVAVTVAPQHEMAVSPVPDQQTAQVADVSDDSIQWQFVTDVLGTLEPDAAHSVLGPSAGAVDAAFTMLTAAERDAFARLLQAEMSEGSN
jgi:hypothetical protein